jgi:acetyltransferase
VAAPLYFAETHRLSDGTEILVRPVRPEDEALIVELHDGHSEQTIRMRFFGMVRRLSHDNLIRLCQLDHDRDVALAALHRGPDGRLHMIGVSRYHLDPATGDAEFAVVVTDAWQGKGVGSYLMRRLAEVGRERGVKRLVGEVLRENTSMVRLMTALGYAIEVTDDPAVVRAVMVLA